MKINLLTLLSFSAILSFVSLSEAAERENSGYSGSSEKGQQLFLANCAECHQSNGQGLNNVYPALAGNETVLGSGADVALVLIIGRGEMPSFTGALSSEEMAAIINYVRNSWGNSGEMITADAIEALQ